MNSLPILAPSILNADFARLGESINMLQHSEADWIHLDIMDGSFVPNISFGMPVIQSIRGLTDKPLDAHLMIVRPENHVQAVRDAGADMITVHYEASVHLNRTIDLKQKSGAKAGVALNPHTPVELLKDIIEMVDLVLIMSVNPGFGGQKFIYQTIPKIKRLRQMIIESNAHALVQVDGGVGLQNIASIFDAGADVFVVGSAIINAKDPLDTIKKLKQISRNQFIV
ncbi:MAG: ribulose-phosphate 3-epimerase [Saprospiraceae bacterium]